jgi:hypothetical protein
MRARSRRVLPGTLALALALAPVLAATPAHGARETTAAAAQRYAVPPSRELQAVSRPEPRRAWVARVLYPTAARISPSFHARMLGMALAVSQWSTPDELLVLGKRTEPDGRTWLRVRLDVRPNGSAVWLNGQDLTVHADPWRISVSLPRHRLHVYRNGHLLRVFRVVVGKPSTPTPTGLFAVAAELRQPHANGFVGSWVLPLTAHSDVLHSFDGGDGQVALHGRGGRSLADPLGSARSHGCVRLANEAIAWIATHVPVGTPVSVA